MKVLTKIFLWVILFLLIPSVTAFSQDATTGAVAKIPYPMNAKCINLEKQDVKMTVYSTFVEVEAEYELKNENSGEVSAVIGFPFYRHSLDISKGESPPMDLKVSAGKKRELFIKRQVEGDINLKEGNIYKEWYLWNLDFRGNEKIKFKTHYFLKLNRDQGIPHLSYTMKQSEAYTGKIKDTEILVNLPFSCEKVPFSSKKIYDGKAYLYSSLPRPKITRNQLVWTWSNHRPQEDLSFYFYFNGFPDWEISYMNRSQEDKGNCIKIMDGDLDTFWTSDPGSNGVDTWFLFKPVNRFKDGKTTPCNLKVSQVGIMPGNCKNISDFYSYSHLSEVEMKIQEASTDTEEIGETKGSTKAAEKKSRDGIDRPARLETPQKITGEPRDIIYRRERKTDRPDVLVMECTADPYLQFSRARKLLDTQKGPLKMTITMVFTGQKNRELCIGEVLIFDRSPNELYDLE